MNTDLKTVNKTVKRCIEDTGRTNEPMVKCGKYITPTLHNSMHKFASTLRKQGCYAFCNYLCVGLIPSHGCTTVQVFTSCNKCGDLNLAILHYNAKLQNLILCQYFWPYSTCPVCGMWYSTCCNTLLFSIFCHIFCHQLLLMVRL